MDAEKKEREQNKGVFATIGELVLVATALDTLLNAVVVQVLHLGSSPLIEPVVATLDAVRKIEILKERTDFIANEEWKKHVTAFVDKVESVIRQRNIACHMPAVLEKGRWTLTPVAAAKVLKHLDLDKPGARFFPINDLKDAIKTGERAMAEGVGLVENFKRFNAALSKKRENQAVVLVFQYGSNCSESEMNSEDRLRGDAAFLDIAETVEDFELAFDVTSKGRRCAASDIVRKAGGTVWGVVYQVPSYLMDRDTAEAAGRKSFDAIEGKQYKRETIPVRRTNGEIVRALTYTVKAPERDVRTSLEYVGHIVRGLRDHKIPDDYIAKVKEIASANNPDDVIQSHERREFGGAIQIHERKQYWRNRPRSKHGEYISR
jgi:hypothetical protein